MFSSVDGRLPSPGLLVESEQAEPTSSRASGIRWGTTRMEFSREVAQGASVSVAVIGSVQETLQPWAGDPQPSGSGTLVAFSQLEHGDCRSPGENGESSGKWQRSLGSDRVLSQPHLLQPKR